jgi:hypothetical protein
MPWLLQLYRPVVRPIVTIFRLIYANSFKLQTASRVATTISWLSQCCQLHHNAIAMF